MEKLCITITNACNFKCKYCFKFEYNINYKKFMQDILFCINNLKNLKKVSLSGGEPLLCPKIEEIIKSLKEKNLQVNLITNFSIYKKNIFKLLDEITISIDSFFKKINLLHRRKMKTIYNFYKTGIKNKKINVVITYFNKSKKNIDKLYNKFKFKKILRIKFIKVLLNKRAKNKNMLFISTKYFDNILKKRILKFKKITKIKFMDDVVYTLTSKGIYKNEKNGKDTLIFCFL